MKKTFIFCFFLGLFFQAHAQYSKEQVIQFLTNGSHRDWLSGKFKSKKNSCRGTGAIFTFFNDGSVQLSMCVKGKPQIKKLKYQIESSDENNNDMDISFTEDIQMDSGYRSTYLRITFDMPVVNTAGKKLFLYIIPNRKTSDEGSLTLLSIN
ncbi:MAG TPA: hypothetical protein VJ844_12225 [Mucilaginibacter sp.]|nr:hypothetical protein [Mucilaginibacter sp.]